MAYLAFIFLKILFLDGAPARTTLGELTALPYTPSRLGSEGDTLPHSLLYRCLRCLAVDASAVEARGTERAQTSSVGA